MSFSPYGSPCHTYVSDDNENMISSGFTEENDQEISQPGPMIALEERISMLPQYIDYDDWQQSEEYQNNEYPGMSMNEDAPKRPRTDSLVETISLNELYTKPKKIPTESYFLTHDDFFSSLKPVEKNKKNPVSFKEEKGIKDFVSFYENNEQCQEVERKLLGFDREASVGENITEETKKEEAPEQSIVDQVLNHLKDKEGKRDSGCPSYGNDELCKKVMRKLTDFEVRNFKNFCDGYPNDLNAWVRMLKTYLYEKHDISSEALNSEECIKLAKELYFPLSVKRIDAAFGHFKDKRGKEGRNAFLRRGTKKEAKIFFTNEIGKKIYYPKFKTILEEFIDSDKKNKQPKLATFLKRLERALQKHSNSIN